MGSRQTDNLRAGPFGFQSEDVGESASLYALVRIIGISSADVAREVGLTRGRIAHFLHPHEHVPLKRRRQFIDMLRARIQGYDETYVRFESGIQPGKETNFEAKMLDMLAAYRNVLLACQALADMDEALLRTESEGPDAGGTTK